MPKQITEFPAVAFKAALTAENDETLTAKTGLSGDRLLRMKEALPLFKERAEKVRVIRVYGKDDAPKNAEVAGDFAFLAEFFSAPGHASHGKKGPRRGKPGQKGPGASEENETLKGRFSMDLVAQDRKRKLASGGERGGRPGGRGRPGGGKRPGGPRGPGGPGGRGPGGAPRPNAGAPSGPNNNSAPRVAAPAHTDTPPPDKAQ